MAENRFQSSIAQPRPTLVRHLVLLLACSLSFILYLHRYAWGFIRNSVGAGFGRDNQTLGTLDPCPAACAEMDTRKGNHV